MKKKFLLSIVLISFLSSCTEDIDLTVVGGEVKIVFEGRIENGKPAEVFVMRSNPLSSTRDYKDFFYVKNTEATVTVSDGTTTENLAIGFDTASSFYFPWLGKRVIGTPGKTYLLTAVVDVYGDGKTFKTYTATTTIPTPVALDSVWWKPEPPYDTLGYAWGYLSEPAGLGNAYRWYAKRSCKRTPKTTIMYIGYGTSIVPITSRIWYDPGIKDRRYLAPIGSTFDDRFIDGKSFDISMERGIDPSDSLSQDLTREDHYFKKTDTIFIKFCTIDLATTKFYTTYEAASLTNGNPFASPVSVMSNINGGGLGIWAGFGCTYDTIVPK